MKLNDKIGLIMIFFLLSFFFFINSLSNHSSTSTGYGIPRSVPIIPVVTMSHLLYLSMACVSVVFLAAFAQWKDNKLFWAVICSLLFIVEISREPSSGVHGRYVDCLIPLILISGFAWHWKEDRRMLAWGSGLLIVCIFSFETFWMDTINSAANVYMYFDVIGFFLFPVLGLFFLMKVKNRKIITGTFFLVLLVTFAAGNVLNYQYLNTASDNAYDCSTIGKYMDDNNVRNIIFDEDDFENWWGSYCLLCYYHGRFIPFEGKEVDFLISSKILEYDVVISQERFSKLEENKTGNLFLYRLKGKNAEH